MGTPRVLQQHLVRLDYQHGLRDLGQSLFDWPVPHGVVGKPPVAKRLGIFVEKALGALQRHPRLAGCNDSIPAVQQARRILRERILFWERIKNLLPLCRTLESYAA